MRRCAAKAQILSKCRIRHSSQSAYFDAVALPRPTARLPLLARILVIADQFLLLGVHRDHRLAPPLQRADLAVDVLELGVAVRVVLTLQRLAVGLEAVTQ